MAAPLKRLCQPLRQCQHRTQLITRRRRPQWQRQSFRPFSNTTTRRAEEDSSDPKIGNESDSTSLAPYWNQALFDRLEPDDQAAYRTYTPDERRQAEKVMRTLDSEFAPDTRFSREVADIIDETVEEIEGEFPEEREERPKRIDSFWTMGEDEELGPDDEFEEDDISSTAHGELEQHREIREMVRLAAWEMPLLSNLAKPFTPPTHAHPLRFRYTTYMGESHPASRKVVVEFAPIDLQDLSAQQQDKLIKLAGPRYNPSTQVIKISCESFETQAQNKRYLGDTVSSLIAEASDPKADTFADVPFDFRHHKVKKRIKFPEEWLLTEERKAYLEAKRKQSLIEEGRKVEEGRMLSGVKAIEAARQLNVSATEAPVMVQAERSMPKGKMGRRQMAPKGSLR